MTGTTAESLLERVSTFVAGLVEGRDPDLGAHHQRLREGTMLFAQYVGYSPEEAQLLSVGARLHDIGKLSISEHILNKPARLTAAEVNLVQRHALIGSQFVEPLGLDPRINEIVLYHHENYDGSGYPVGLVGEAIPVMARIVRIWDSFDALTITRPYQRAVSPAQALHQLQQRSQLYDPYLLKSFCELMSKHRMPKTGRQHRDA
ncbi:MAG TPA: HD domain-containing phosphohydrolase [Blastocatellia bacterium]|nr:HD domain-containing phosphohydrolase [Blastocatellia bacterium]